MKKRKIVVFGAGSTIFTKNLVGDCLLTPSLRDAEYALVDVDQEKLYLTESMLKNLNNNINEGQATIKAYEDAREALQDADFVINTIKVGGYDAVLNDFEIPLKYGIKQTFADTLGIGGIFNALRTIPEVMKIAENMEELCPNAWLLNYSNPMCMITGTVLRGTNVKAVGLCHSVQVVSKHLLEDVGLVVSGYRDKVAGINHQGWLLEITDEDGNDLYPEIKKRAYARTDRHEEYVRYEIMKSYDYYVTESPQHSAEYMPYFIKRQYPELLKKLNIKTEMYKNWGSSQQEFWEEAKHTMIDNVNITHERTYEYASYIMEAMITDIPYKIAGNVLNKGFITNLPNDAVVEIPCLVDSEGVTPTYFGALPPQCAGLNLTNITPQQLVQEAYLTKNVKHVYHAAILDPHTAAELSLDDIHSMVDELIEVNKQYLTYFNLEGQR